MMDTWRVRQGMPALMCGVRAVRKAMWPRQIDLSSTRSAMQNVAYGGLSQVCVGVMKNLKGPRAQ